MTSAANDFAAFFGTKAFEIAYALMRIAAYSGNDSFKAYIESYAMMLVDGVARGQSGSTQQSLQAIRQFMALGVPAGLLKQIDADLVIHAASDLNAAIAAFVPVEHVLPDLQLAEIFSSGDLANLTNQPKRAGKSDKQPEAFPRAALSAPSNITNALNRSIVSSNGNSSNGEDRQKKILEKIRQSGNCRMKELQDYLPHVSERTLRYDLQQLVGAGKVERFGTGGPSVYYTIRSEAVISLPATLPPPTAV